MGQPKPVTVPAPLVLSTTTATTTKTDYQLLGKVTPTATATTTVTSTVVALSSVSTTTITVLSTTTTTALPACATNNLVSTLKGVSIINAFNNGAGKGSTFSNSQVDSAEACCALCQTTTATNGAGSEGFAFESGSCVILYSEAGTCAAGQSAGYVMTNAEAVAYTFGNGPCGYFYNGGQN